MKKKTKSNKLVLNFFALILRKMKIEMLQFLLSIFISVEKRMFIWVYRLSFLAFLHNYLLIRTINIS